MVQQPDEKQRAWAEMLRTLAAICTVLITFMLALDKLGVW